MRLQALMSSPAGTPQLFTQRRGLFCASAEAPLAAPGPAASAAAADECVKVVVRIRPPSVREQAEGAATSCLQHTGVDTLMLHTSPEPVHFTMDHVAGASSTQEHIFRVVGRPIVDNTIAGVSVCVWCACGGGGGGGGGAGRAGRGDGGRGCPHTGSD